MKTKPKYIDRLESAVIHTHQCKDCDRKFAAKYQAKTHSNATGHWVRKL